MHLPRIATWLVLPLALACRRGAAGGADEDEAKPVIELRCVAAASATVADAVTLRGILTSPPDRDAVVAPGAAGRLAEIDVTEGQAVARGARLAVVDAPGLTAALTEAESAARSAHATEDAARENLERQVSLEQRGIAAHRDVEEATAREAAAGADVRASEARVAAAQAELARAEVRAPIAGTVVHILRRAGELVDGTPATPVVELADPSTLELRSDVPAAELVKLADGDAAQVRLDALPGEALPAHIAAIAPAVDPATALGTVRVALASPDPRLRLGLAGHADVTLATRTVVTVPAPAVRRDTEGKSQVVVCASDHAAVRSVEARPASAGTIEVTGVQAGELVAVTHVLNLADGDPIKRGD